ncbi:sensor histidine kinase [Microbacterium sp. A93]|uniref:sensor histidine kinase n=1 Tax=Microbacterium sp. A93 TaxID=3450716 RepID=UPI003F424FA4
MSIETELREEIARAERRESVFYSVLPYALLAISTVLTLLQIGQGERVALPAILGLTLVTTVWLSVFSRAQGDRRNGTLIAVSYTGLMITAAALVVLSPWYGVFAFVGYIHAFLLLAGPWRYVGVAATSIIMAVSYVGGWDNIAEGRWGVWVTISAVTGVLAGTSFYFAASTDVTGRKQKQVLALLHDANAKLEGALEENAGLHAQLLVQAREAGILDERQRIAGDLHDTLAQSLAGILTQLQAAEQTMGDAPAARRHLTNALALARESLTDARRTIHAVEPDALAHALLPEAIGEVTRRWAESHLVDAVFTVTGDARPLHTDVEATLLRTAQEALTNVAKHAKAGRVGLTLSYMEDLVTLDVRDDGVGFAPDLARTAISKDGGFGLTAMRQRVRRLAGQVVIESEPGAGTALSATVPATPVGGTQ